MSVDQLDELEVSTGEASTAGGDNHPSNAAGANEANSGAGNTGTNPSAPSVPKSGEAAVDFERIGKITVSVEAILGGLSMPVSQLMGLKKNEVLTLDKDIGALVEIRANGNPIARGEIVVIEGDKPRFGVSITEIIHNS